jgi:ketosteroid isomerase-like protein
MNSTTRKIGILAIALLVVGTLGCRTSRPDIVHQTFPAEQAKIQQLVNEIYACAQSKNAARLPTYHLYGPKFTEFKNGEPRHDAATGEQHEREVLAAVSDFKYDLQDLKVNVFGQVAIATFHGNFGGTTAEKPFALKLQGTMVFVKDVETWKIAHEHFSPLK